MKKRDFILIGAVLAVALQRSGDFCWRGCFSGTDYRGRGRIWDLQSVRRSDNRNQ